MKLPEYVKIALDILEKNGYDAYVVGGCVRDTLLGITPYDWDICTSAKPEEILKSFAEYETDETGIAYGTVRVKIEDEKIEVTTFRKEGKYLDNRHPESISFTQNIKEDLIRRDFTVNALAYNEKNGLIDIFDGMTDLKNKIIRCIGEPEKRFNEDALRIMRAIRFCATLRFTLDEKTKEAVFKCSNLLKNIPREIVERELISLVKGKDGLKIATKYIEVIRENPPQIETGKRNIKKWRTLLGDELYNKLI